MTATEPRTHRALSLVVEKYTDIVGPSVEMLGPVPDGGLIEYRTVPGCWGPMITPSLRSGHEVTLPVRVENAQVGDSIVIKVLELEQLSRAGSSGTHEPIEGRFVDDPFVAGICPTCRDAGREYRNPGTRIEGLGEQAVRCLVCGSEVSPFRMGQAYTIAFDEEYNVGVTIAPGAAREVAMRGREWMGISEFATQHPIVALGRADLVGMAARCRISIGNLGTIPGIDLPSSHNAGDFGASLVGARHEFSVTERELLLRTDAHMDIDSVRAGTVLIVPVKVDGGGIYAGDVHAMIGDGEIAGHAVDISARLVVQVNLLKGVTTDGPILLPPPEDLPFLAQPFTSAELDIARRLATQHDTQLEGPRLPLQVLGSGSYLNLAVDNGVERAARLLGLPVDEIRNRVTITGAVEIGRLPGMVQVTLLAPEQCLDDVGVLEAVRAQYGERV